VIERELELLRERPRLLLLLRERPRASMYLWRIYRDYFVVGCRKINEKIPKILFVIIFKGRPEKHIM